MAWCFSWRGIQNWAAHLEWSRVLAFWLGGTISISMFRGRRRQPRAGGNEARAVTGSRDGAQPKARRTGGGLAPQLLGVRVGLDVRCIVGSGPEPAGWGWVSSLSGCLSDVEQWGPAQGARLVSRVGKRAWKDGLRHVGPFPPGERRPPESGGQKAAHGGLFFLAPLLAPRLALRQGSGLVHPAGGTWDPVPPAPRAGPRSCPAPPPLRLVCSALTFTFPKGQLGSTGPPSQGDV